MLGTQWIAKQIASAVIAAVPMALDFLVQHFSHWVKVRSMPWRERIRRRIWWPRKLASILTRDIIDDDERADAIGDLFLFVHPPEDSGWRLEGTEYIPGPGSGYVRLADGSYQKVV